MYKSCRHLPHQYVIGQPMFVTFRLHGSLPAGREFSIRALTHGRASVCMDKLLHQQRFGPLYLQMPVIAQTVATGIRNGSLTDYELHAWVVMPNHTCSSRLQSVRRSSCVR